MYRPQNKPKQTDFKSHQNKILTGPIFNKWKPKKKKKKPHVQNTESADRKTKTFSVQTAPKHHIIEQFLAYTYKYSTFTKMTHEGEGE